MQSGEIEILKSCGIAVRRFFSNGTVSEDEIKALRQGRIVLRRFICELSESDTGGNASCYRDVLQALESIHPRMEFSCSEIMIRELADICLTLKRMENGKGRTIDGKLPEAKMFCDILVDELRNLGPDISKNSPGHTSQ